MKGGGCVLGVRLCVSVCICCVFIKHKQKHRLLLQSHFLDTAPLRNNRHLQEKREGMSQASKQLLHEEGGRGLYPLAGTLSIEMTIFRVPCHFLSVSEV